jgi:polysaccharide biosynthesis transport protein
MAQYDVDLRDYWRILKKRKLVVVLMVLLAGISSYGFAKLKEPIALYEASASVKIERVSNMADFFSGGFWAQEENITTQAFIITSFPVLEQAAKILGWIPEDISEDEIRLSINYMSIIQKLKSIVQAGQEAGTNIVNIRVTSRDKESIAQVANAFAQAFRDYNIQEKNRQTFETKEFIEKQLNLTSANLKNSEEQLRMFKEGHALVALDTQTADILARLSAIETLYDEVYRKKEAILSQLALMEAAQESEDLLEKTSFPSIQDSPVQGMVETLRGLVLKRKTLLFDYTEKHPEVVETSDQIASIFDEIKKELISRVKGIEARESDLLQKLDILKKENRSLPQKALEMARFEREVALQEALYSQLKTRYQETLIKESGRVEEVTVIRPALPPTNPINIPSKMMIVITGTIVGLVIGIVFTFVAETLDTSIGTIEDIESLLNVPVLGVIPAWGKDDKGQQRRELGERGGARDLVTHYDPTSLAAEAFRSLRTNIQFLRLDKKGKSFLVTSSFLQEGKTSNVVNIALSIAQAGDRVLLVEGDLRKPVVHKIFGLSKAPGLTDYVLGNYPWHEVVSNITDLMLGDFEIEDILKTPGLDNLHIMTGGTNPPNPSEILRSPRFREFIKEAYEYYDYIFIDAPPILPVADATEIAPHTDGVVLVYKVGAIARSILNRAKLTLDNVSAKVVGVILNNVKPEVGPDYFKYQTHYYYGPSEDTGDEKKGVLLKYLKIAILIFAAVLLLIGFFWEDVLSLLS